MFARSSVTGLSVALLCALGASPVAVTAQQSPPDFQFRAPTISLTLRAGVFLPRADSEIFDFTTEQLTLDRSDFRAGSMGGELGVWLGDRAELVVGLEGSQITRRSEFRDWVEENGDPIEQDTQLRVGPAGYVGGNLYLHPRGEQFGQFVWIPRGWNAFAGGGIGRMSYAFRQWGDFVDTEREEIFSHDFASDGSSLLYYANGGVDVRVTNRTYVLAEGRYQWSDASLTGQDFRRFDPIDLSGLRLSLGLAFRF